MLRPAIIDYAVGSIPLENVFVETNEGLYLKTWNGFQWQTPVNLGLPPGEVFPTEVRQPSSSGRINTSLS